MVSLDAQNRAKAEGRRGGGGVRLLTECCGDNTFVHWTGGGKSTVALSSTYPKVHSRSALVAILI